MGPCWMPGFVCCEHHLWGCLELRMDMAEVLYQRTCNVRYVKRYGIPVYRQKTAMAVLLGNMMIKSLFSDTLDACCLPTQPCFGTHLPYMEMNYVNRSIEIGNHVHPFISSYIIWYQIMSMYQSIWIHTLSGKVRLTPKIIPPVPLPKKSTTGSIGIHIYIYILYSHCGCFYTSLLVR